MVALGSRILLLVLVCLVGSGVLATTVDFESAVTGQSVNLQLGWTVEDEWNNDPIDAGKPLPFDELVVDDGTGNNVWRYSNAVGYTEYAFQPYSHIATVPAGESGSALWNDRGPDHTMPLSPPNPGTPVGTNLFHAGFRFKSATGAAQADLGLTISPSAKQSAFRVSWISINDDGANGFDVSFYETGTSADPWGTGNQPEVASDLAYGVWHTIDIYIEFVDGLNPDTTGNDCVTIVVNGAVVYQGTSWESFYDGANPGNLNPIDQPHRQAVDSLLFRNTANIAANDGGGIYFDDVVIDNAAGPVNCIEPLPDVAGWGLAGLGILLCLGLAGALFLRHRAA
jgi:hypothetical protein